MSIARHKTAFSHAKSLSSLWDENPEDDFSDSYNSAFGEDGDCFSECFRETSERLGLSATLEEAILSDQDKHLSYIQSIVGDDDHTTTNSAALGPCFIGFGPLVSGVRISWKDSGISPFVGNYAEGWILTPPNAEASFEAVNRRNQRSGIPFTLDQVKTKFLSPVRKQSSEEMDLQSKVLHLSEVASWTDKSWFTYDYHQMALILANCIFDFEDAVSFPFLYRTEGGCGGSPPYGNLETLYSSLHYYTRGKSRGAILGIMTEAVEINLNKMKPADGFFTRSTRLSQMGDAKWLHIEAAYRSLLNGRGLSHAEAADLLRSEGSVELPPDLLDLATEVTPDSYAVGSAISHLRKDGFVMSEIDVKMLLDQRSKERAIGADQPIGDFLRQQKEETAVFKGQNWKLLTELAATSGPIRDYLHGLLGAAREGWGDRFKEIATAYYRLRSEAHDQFSSFYYTDSVRLFKTSDINAYFSRGVKPLLADFAKTDILPAGRKRFLEENREEKRRLDFLADWMDSADLADILSRPLPPGIGPDDSRVARSIIDAVEGIDHRVFPLVKILVFTGDKKLLRLTAALVAAKNLPCRIAIYGVNRFQYTEICLDAVAEKTLLESQGRLAPGKLPERTGGGVLYYNAILSRLWPLPESVVTELLDKRGLDVATALRSSTFIHLEYDFPNMERGLDLLRYNRSTNTIDSYGGGFLSRRTIDSIGRDACWSQTPLTELRDWSDFDTHRVSTQYRLRGRVLKPGSTYLYDPVSRSTYSAVEKWRHTLPLNEWRSPSTQGSRTMSSGMDSPP